MLRCRHYSTFGSDSLCVSLRAPNIASSRAADFHMEEVAKAGTAKADAAAPPGDAQGSAAKPAAKFTPLSHLTAHSARFGLWEVMVFNPIASEREYIWDKQQRTSYTFQTKLVSTADPTQYMLGDSHGKGMNKAKLKQLKDKFKHGLVFHMSKVVFADNTKKQYNSTPKSEVVSMLNTTWSPVLGSAGKPIMPEPGIPIVASMGINSEQQFDALALIQEVSASNSGGRTRAGQERVRCQIILNDGSRNSDGNVCHLPVTIFEDASKDGQDPPLFQKLRSAAEHKIAMAFFGIQGKQSEDEPGKWSFTSSFGFSCKHANETTKGKMLEAEAAKLAEAQADVVPQSALQSRNIEQNEDFASVEATETTCALLKSIMAKTDVRDIEDSSTFWQINRCRVHLPEKAAQVCTNDNSRLWMSVKVEDETAQLHIYMREKAALSLSGAETKEEFEDTWANDTLDFPNKASIKVIRKPAAPQTPTAEDSAAKPAQITCYIVEAAEQAIEDTPSKSSLILLSLLEKTEAQTDACVPACISTIKKDPHYGLSVSYVVDGEVIQKRCTKAVALVSASSASKSDNMNEGYQMVTEGVRDALKDDFVCTLMSFCTVEKSPDYQFKPARGIKTQTALVVIIDVLDAGGDGKPPVFLVDSMDKIPDKEMEAAPDHIRRHIQFASLTAKMQGKSSKREWTDEASPAIARKCRRLGKSPTDDLLDKYTL